MSIMVGPSLTWDDANSDPLADLRAFADQLRNGEYQPLERCSTCGEQVKYGVTHVLMGCSLVHLWDGNTFRTFNLAET